ncbi:hypothetical protein AK830_g2612 [Neonectria ditissima]|uniref:F-box domain-containing protein n=1 Tax=Neonectria ditissima TaxID=78410 RepID=A0A0P7BAU3_9HYPO|nr:hypothetical protein AK830_g2612 [Neonectria ditissima]
MYLYTLHRLVSPPVKFHHFHIMSVLCMWLENTFNQVVGLFAHIFKSCTIPKHGFGCVLTILDSHGFVSSDGPRQRQQYYQMRQTLREFEKHMDPQTAAALYNAKNSLLHRLPNEILFRVMAYAAHDDLSFACLRQVSRLFRRLVNAPAFRNHKFSTWNECRNCIGEDVRCAKIWDKGSAWYCRRRIWPNSFLLNEMKKRLLRDRFCAPCLREHVSNSLDKGIVEDYIHCAGCECHHLSTNFSAAEKAKPSIERICIGRQGFIRICEHQAVTWDDVEQVLNQMKRDGSANLSEIVVKSCHHAAHVFCCPDMPSPPRLQLHKSDDSDTFTLELRWAPHSSLEGLAAGKISASETRAMAKKYQADAARFILDERITGHYLPEMECFPANCCDCLQYDDLQVDQVEKMLGLAKGFFRPPIRPSDSPAMKSHTRIGCWEEYQSISYSQMSWVVLMYRMRSHARDDGSESIAIVTDYKRKILSAELKELHLGRKIICPVGWV